MLHALKALLFKCFFFHKNISMLFDSPWFSFFKPFGWLITGPPFRFLFCFFLSVECCKINLLPFPHFPLWVVLAVSPLWANEWFFQTPKKRKFPWSFSVEVRTLSSLIELMWQKSDIVEENKNYKAKCHFLSSNWIRNYKLQLRGMTLISSSLKEQWT